jgi:hypothetical protein
MAQMAAVTSSLAQELEVCQISLVGTRTTLALLLFSRALGESATPTSAKQKDPLIRDLSKLQGLPVSWLLQYPSANRLLV